MLIKLYSKQKIYILIKKLNNMVVLARKIQLVGNRSYSVSLPKEWVLHNNLKEKDTVNIEISKSNDLVISASQKNPIRSVEITIDKGTHIPELIFLCFNKEIDELVLKSKEFSLDQIKKIKRSIHIVEGYNIIDESSSQIKIVSISQNFNYTLRKLVGRTVYLLSNSCNALATGDIETIEENEHEINKFYHLSKRLLIKAIHDTKIRAENLIWDTMDIFIWNSNIKKLENIGDILYDMRNIDFPGKAYQTIHKYISLVNDIFIKIKGYAELESYVQKNIKLQNRLKSIEGRVHLLCKDIMENMIMLDLNQNYFRPA